MARKHRPRQGKNPSQSNQGSINLPSDEAQRAKVIEAEIIENPEILASPRVMEILMSQESYQGPVPPAKQFAGYEAASPGAGLQLLEMSKKALEAQIQQASRAQEKDFEEAERGQWMAFALALATITGAAVMSVYGGEWPGAVFGTTGLGSIIYMFIQGKKRR